MEVWNSSAVVMENDISWIWMYIENRYICIANGMHTGSMEKNQSAFAGLAFCCESRRKAIISKSQFNN